MFTPLRWTRSWHDWSTPAAGCPRCGYAYEREPGYFLPAIWVVHVFTVFGLGMAIGLVLNAYLSPSLGALMLMASVPSMLFALLFIRHAKAIYLAFDHFISPQARAAAAESERQT